MKKRPRGMVRLGAYYVPMSIAGKHKRQVKSARKLALSAMLEFCHSSASAWKGSQDGEAVLGFDKMGKIKALIHLDPQGVQLILSAAAKGDLVKTLKEIN